MQCIATIRTKWGGRGYSGLPVSKIEDYTVDSAMDTDTDQWSIDIGDPRAELVDILRRDSEVTVGLTLKLPGYSAEPLLQGFADTIALTHDGKLSLQGRDITAAAVDDTAEPYQWHMARPDIIIQQQARARGISKFQLAKVAPIPNLYTDGSESVWALWYRMIRKKKMWIWAAGDGTLNVNALNYGESPSYFFGTPTRDYPNSRNWIPVQESDIVKNTNTRVGQVWVYGDDGKVGFGPIKAVDDTIKDWIKRPLHIITADAAHTNRAEALKEAQEEVFESIVGSIEVTLTIPNPGFVIKQNKIAYLNLPQSDFRGEYFVVGVRTIGSTNGMTQEVRLREKKYALSRRVPSDPALKEPAADVSASALGSSLSSGSHDWGQYFVIAAKAWHGGWDFDLFLAALMAICQKETNFMNVREGSSGGPEWYGKPQGEPNGRPYLQWKENFANAAGNPLNPFSREAGVGPMQLTTASYKHDADAYMGIFDEYEGGRWHPSANIYIGGKVLASKLQGLPQTETNFWIGIERYNGSGPAAEAYMQDVKRRILNDFLPQIQSQMTQSGNILPGNSTKTLASYGTSVPDSIRKIINYAERQEGKPYQLGAEGPDSYDCSGLAYAAYHAAGLDGKIGGRQTTWGYWANGSGWGSLEFVSVDKLLPGDMVFFSVPQDGGTPPQHMGIFYQDNTMIVAPHTGDVVKVESIISDSWTCMGGMRLAGIWPVSTSDSSNYDPNEPGRVP